MESVLTILWQVVIMFLLAGVGFVMFKTRKISLEASKGLGNILIFLSLPCVIINSFLVDRTPERMAGLWISIVCALAVLVLSGIVSRIFCGNDAIANFAGTFSNPGFFGIPLITACLAEGSAFYIAAFIAFLNLGQWTYGVSLLENSDREGRLIKSRKDSAEKIGFGQALAVMGKKLVKAPFMVAIIIGLFFFLTQLPMPVIFAKCITNIANLNTPLAMFTTGIYLAQTDIGKMFAKPKLYLISAVRMIACPAAALLVLSLVPAQMADLKMAILIAAACPVGSNIAVYAQLHNKNYTYAVETVVISTILSIITLPFVVGVAGIIW